MKRRNGNRRKMSYWYSNKCNYNNNKILKTNSCLSWFIDTTKTLANPTKTTSCKLKTESKWLTPCRPSWLKERILSSSILTARVATVTTSWSTNTMINTAMTNMETKTSSTVLVSMGSRVRMKTSQTSITNRMIRSIWWTIKPTPMLKTLTQFRIDKSLACSTIATFKCNIIPKAGPIKDKCHLINLTLAMKKRFTTQSSRKSWSNFSTSCKREKIALMALNLTPREEMAQLEGKPGNWFQMSHLLGLTSWESSWKSNTFVNLKMTKSSKCITTQMNTVSTSCSIQLLTNISMKSLKPEECALKYSRPPEWKMWVSSLSTSALPIAPLASALILLQLLKELAAMISTQMVDRWLISIPLKQPNSTTLKSTKCSVLRIIQLKLNKAWEMSRIALTSTLKTRINTDIVIKKISTSKRRSEILMFLAWSPPTCQVKWSKTSTKTISALQVNIKVHEHRNDKYHL